MFCPECGEVIGSGPLDARRALYENGWRARNVTGIWRHRIRALLRGLRRAASAGQG